MIILVALLDVTQDNQNLFDKKAILFDIYICLVDINRHFQMRATQQAYTELQSLRTA